MIDRPDHVSHLKKLLRDYPVVAILGARQIGKTTLARELAQSHRGPVTTFDLEDPAALARLQDPSYALGSLKGLVILDEIQRRPELFQILRVLADRRPIRARFLVLGSASPHLLRQSSESLAGRIAFYELPGLSLSEVPAADLAKLWTRGGFPRSYLARNEAASHEWRQNFIRTFVERDLPQLGVTIAADTMRRFWTMLAHHHAQIWNSSELARAFGVADKTVRSYLDRLSDALVIRQLAPWHENLAKRQVKSPKVYVRDTGLLHSLLRLPAQRDIAAHPKVGASWEGFIIEQIICQLRLAPSECYFWRTYQGAELDLLVVRGSQRLGFEIKHTSAPQLSPSMRTALSELKLDSLALVHSGTESYPISERIEAVAASELIQTLKEFR
ncbi:MAG: ATP-binding protein [Gammaproteobacteria bacterium]|nr:ATP-binding protein [Gammaproteobacteria bacterium]